MALCASSHQSLSEWGAACAVAAAALATGAPTLLRVRRGGACGAAFAASDVAVSEAAGRLEVGGCTALLSAVCVCVFVCVFVVVCDCVCMCV